MHYTEQRKFERYQPPEGAIANLKPDAEFGLISDISCGGVAFECLSFLKDRCKNFEIGCPKEIDLFIPGENSMAVTVPCMVVRVEKRLSGSYRHSVVSKKRCGVQFMKFGMDAAMGLFSFLGKCTRKGEC